jgi:hypothetical protein
MEDELGKQAGGWSDDRAVEAKVILDEILSKVACHSDQRFNCFKLNSSLYSLHRAQIF